MNPLLKFFATVYALLVDFVRSVKGFMGFASVVISSVVALIVCTILLEIGPVISQNVYNSMPAVTGTANTTVTAVNTAVMNGFQLATIYPILIVAVGLVGTIIAGFAGYAYARGRD